MPPHKCGVWFKCNEYNVLLRAAGGSTTPSVKVSQVRRQSIVPPSYLQGRG